MYRKFYLTIFIITTVFLSNPALAQLSKHRVHALNIVNIFAKGVEWPNESEIDTFKITVFDNYQLYKFLDEMSEKMTIRGKNFVVNHVSKQKEIQNPQILIVGINENSNIKLIFKELKDNPILLITDNCSEAAYTMINIISESTTKRFFELNKNNLEKARLTPTNKLLLYGGSVDDLQSIYRESEKELDKKREEIEVQKERIVKQRKAISKQESQIKEQEGQIKKQEAEIASKLREIKNKQIEIEKQTEQIDKQKSELNELTSAVDKKQEILASKIRDMKKFEGRIEEQTKKLEEGEKLLETQNEEISKQQAEIKTQKVDITKKDVQIEEKDALLNYSFVIIGLFSIVVILILLGYREKRKTNKRLAAKNLEIEQKGEEIETQKENLQRQNDYIRTGIQYALTIQQNILPPATYINQHFEHFIFYQPKDIVSGDFYWMSEPHGDSVYLAAVDCTGHGVPGAFMSLIGSRILTNIVDVKKMTKTDEILQNLHIEVQNALRQNASSNDDGMDVCLCKITKNGTTEVDVEFTGAMRPFIYRNAETKEIKTIKGCIKAVGGHYYDGFQFTSKKFKLKKGDIIYLTSDGYADQSNPERKRFTNRKLLALVNEIAEKPFVEQERILSTTINAHQQDSIQRDDMLVFAVKL